MSKKRDLEVYRAQLQQVYKQFRYAEDQHPKPVRFRFQPNSLGSIFLNQHEELRFVKLAAEIEMRRGKISLEDISLSFEYECSRDCCDGDGSVTVSLTHTAKEEDPLWADKMKIWAEEWELAPTTREKVKTDNEQERLKALRKEVAALEAKLKK